jgi:hypothetical protein
MEKLGPEYRKLKNKENNSKKQIVESNKYIQYIHNYLKNNQTNNVSNIKILLDIIQMKILEN